MLKGFMQAMLGKEEPAQVSPSDDRDAEARRIVSRQANFVLGGRGFVAPSFEDLKGPKGPQ